MTGTVFGRTNLPIPRGWYRVLTGETDIACIPLGAVVDVSAAGPTLGHLLRLRADVLLAVFSGFELEHAPSESRAADLTTALILQHISSSCRSKVDFFMLQIRRTLRDDQLNGAISALEEARQEGLIGHIGLSIDGPLYAVLPTWILHDAFDLCLVNSTGATSAEVEAVVALAAQRRVAVVLAASVLPGEATTGCLRAVEGLPQ